MAHSPTLETNQTAAAVEGAEVHFDDDGHYEIVDGERRELEPMGVFETALASELAGFLREFVRKHKLGLVVTEALFVLDAETQLQRRPHVAFVSYPRWPERCVPRSNAWNVVPDLAVEVVSPTNRAEEIDGKLTDYFAAGVHLVWVLYPQSGRLYAYRSPTRVVGLDQTGQLDGGDVLPGFSLPIASLFEAVTRPD